MYKNDDEATKERIKKQEKKYRYITTLLLNDLFSGTTNTIKHTPYWEKVDVRFTATTDNYTNYTYDIEVKERNKDIIESPFAELKVEKYERMKKVNYNKKLLYIVFLNKQEAYIYDLSSINLDTIEQKLWHIKETQYDDSSEYEDVLTYFIPVSKAIKIINVEKYYKLYNANNQ